MINRKRINPTINSGSMADIALLLLVFFMVVTSIQREKSIAMKLPPKYEGQAGSVNDNRVVGILINNEDQVMIEGQLADSNQSDIIKSQLEEMVVNNLKPYVSIKIHEASSFDAYTNLLSNVKKSIWEIKVMYADQLYGKEIHDLNQIQIDKLNKRLSIKISESQFATL